jgi:hypothetical protein
MTPQRRQQLLAFLESLGFGAASGLLPLDPAAAGAALATLDEALTHSSTGQPRHHDRLEFLGDAVLRLAEQPVGRADLQAIIEAVGEFGADNRAGIEGTLHRISAIRNRRGDIIGLTLRVGRAVSGTIDLIRAAGGEVHTYDFAEAKGPRRKPDVGMANDLEALLTSTFGPWATIDKQASLMVGDSAWSSKDTRPDGKPGTHFSNSDRLFAANVGVAFHEPAQFFGWQALGIEGFDNHDALVRFEDQNKGASQKLLDTQTPLTAPTSLAPSSSSALHVRLGNR